MALFSRKKTTESSTSKASASAAKSSDQSSKSVTSVEKPLPRPVLKGLRITEKAVIQNDQNTYVFDVDVRATAPEVKSAVKRIYDVTPSAVNMVNIPAKAKMRRGKAGKTARGRKAYVTLPAGQSIELA